MNRPDAIDLYDDLEARFPGFSRAPSATKHAFAEDLAGIPAEFATAAAKSLLYQNPDRLPNGAAIRRRAMEDAGLLAPPWPEAHRLIGEAAAGQREWRDLPGPVRVLDVDDAHADWLKPVEECYRAEAEAHDRRVLAPGGIEELIAAAQWIDEVRRRADLLAQARHCQGRLGLLIRGDMTDDEAEAVLERWRAERPDEPLALGPVVDADEHWEPHDSVLARIEEARRRAAGGAL